MYLPKTPVFLQQLFPQLLCKVPGAGHTVYLTFDDGPTPGVTDVVLQLLQEYNAQATFFCLGKQVQQHPGLYEQILAHGHRVGNHGQNHLDGWRTPTATYLADVEEAERLITSPLFRPPYGRLRPAQYKALLQRYQLVLWDVMPGDFVVKRSANACYQVLRDNVEPGSIIVLHDSEKGYTKLKDILPRFLNEFSNKGYTFAALP